MEKMTLLRVPAKLPKKLELLLASPAFLIVDGGAFFSYFWKKKKLGLPNVQRYGDMTGCEASINGIHVADFCQKGDDVISIGFEFIDRFLAAWKDQFETGVTIVASFVSKDQEFGPDVSFTFHQTRPGIPWTNLAGIEEDPQPVMVIES